jgi:Conserved hypothetical ATP binding protein
MKFVGKSSLVQRINSYLSSMKKKRYVLNLDPAIKHLGYNPNIDIRDTVNYKKGTERPCQNCTHPPTTSNCPGQSLQAKPVPLLRSERVLTEINNFNSNVHVSTWTKWSHSNFS